MMAKAPTQRERGAPREKSQTGNLRKATVEYVDPLPKRFSINAEYEIKLNEMVAIDRVVFYPRNVYRVPGDVAESLRQSLRWAKRL